MIDLIQNLNSAQRAAVTHLKGPLMIIAGAGTGKTRVITYRIAFLSREVGIPLQRILAVTFTNKAAKEMRERVCHILGVPDTPGLSIGTFHARCAMMLRREAPAAKLEPDFNILDENDQKQAIKRVIKDLKIPEKRVTPGQVQSFINNAKMKLLTPADCKAEMDDDEIPYPDIYAAYQKVLDQAGSLDFEDLLMRTVMLFQDDEAARERWARRYQYVLIDEYQDTNYGQFLLSKLLAQDHREICVVGDEDQSIYSWRGAEISNLLDFQKTFEGATLIKLEHNYRSTGNILKAASTVIARNTQRIGKVLFTEEPEGPPITFIVSPSAEEEGTRIAAECATLINSGVSPDEIAIFYRGHWLSRAPEDAMRRFRIPYRIVGGLRFYDRAEIKDLLSFLRLAVRPEDDLAFERVMNRPSRKVGDKTQEEVAAFALDYGLTMFTATRRMLDAGLIKGPAKGGLQKFTDAILGWYELAQEGSTPSEILKAVLRDTNYKEDGVGDVKSIEAESKLENIDEFIALLEGFASDEPEGTNLLSAFLTDMALDAAEQQTDESAKVNLLTIHNAKGLEFQHVFVIGLEKGVFPTSRSEESEDGYAVEEERRLFYVAITRARKKLTLCYSRQRNRPDFWSFTEGSRFLAELPPDVFDAESQRQLKRVMPSFGRASSGIGGTDVDGERRFVPDPGYGQPRPILGNRGGLSRGTAPGARGAAPKFTVGSRVVHKYMGAGVISEMGGRPGWERIMVSFDDGREQEFVLKYAPIVAEG